MSLRAPQEFAADLDALEEVEQATLRFICQGVYDLLPLAAQQFGRIQVGGDTGDKANYVGEDLTRMALDRIGAPRVPDGRLFGAVDYKLAAYQFLPDFAVRQALFVDSKAEKNALNVMRIQVTQTSLEIRQERAGQVMAVAGRISPVWMADEGDYLTTTAFVKYHYGVEGVALSLREVTVVGLPSGFLQDRYNPTAADGIWNAGPDAPTLGEKFRTRVNFTKLRNKARWRVQKMRPAQGWEFIR
jgi:hypothetical protein